MTRTAIKRSIQLLVLFAIAVAFLTQLGPRNVSGATPLTFIVQGTVTSVDASLAGTFAIGQTFTTTYTFDSSTPDTTGNANRGNYAAISSYKAVVGTYQVTDTDGKITVFDNLGGNDKYSAESSFNSTLSGPNVGGIPPVLSRITLEDTTGTAVASDDLPTTPPDPANYARGSQFIRFEVLPGPGGGFGVVTATIDSIRNLHAVGGVTSFSSGTGSSGSIVLLAGAISAAVVITASAWYTRRRWLGS